MTLRPYKFLVQAVVQDVDDDGNTRRELVLGSGRNGSPAELFGVEGLVRWANEFDDKLQQLPIPNE